MESFEKGWSMTEKEEYQQYLKQHQSAQAPKAQDAEAAEYQQYLKEMEALQAPPEVANPAVVAARNFAQGGSANFSDEIAGLTEAAGRVIGLKGAGESDDSKLVNFPSLAEEGPTLDWETLRDAYRSTKQKEREKLKQDKKDNPALANTANIVGAVVSPVNKLAKGMSLAKGGMTVGGISGFGGSDSDSVVGNLVDTGIGMVAGGTVGKVVEKAAPVFKGGTDKIGQKAKAGAEWLSARAQGLERATAKKLGPERVKEIGRQGLNNGLMNLRGGTDEMIAKNEALKKGAMDARAAVYDKIDEAGASTFNPLEVAAKVEEKILKGLDRSHDDTQEIIKALEPHLSNILSRGEGNTSMAAAQKLINGLSEKAKFDTSRSSTQNRIAKEVYHTVRDAINRSAGDSAEKLGEKGLRQTVEAANKTYATGMGASTLLKNKGARETGNNIFGLTDTITGTGAGMYGLTTGDWDTALGAIATKKVLGKYGAKVGARALDSLSKSFSKTPTAAAAIQKNPNVVSAILKGFEERLPSMPKAAQRTGSPDGETSVADLKGEKKWAVDGLAKVIEHSGEEFASENIVQAIISTPQGRQLLVQASDLKPGSKAMENIVSKMKNQIGEK
jgi:hypothetical protein